jgi:hypothetical protein
MGAVNAGVGGVNAGVADILGTPVDTMRRITELAKAGAGSAYGALTSTDELPAGEKPLNGNRGTLTTHGLYHYIDPTTGSDTFSKNPPPSGSRPYTVSQVSIPSFLQPTPDANDVGGSASIKAGMEAVGGPGVTTPTENTPLNRMIHAGGEALPYTIATPEAPVSGAISNFMGGASAQAAKEAGGGPIAQTLAGLAGGSLPALGTGIASATRLAVRGGSAGQADMQARLADASASDTSLSAGQASGSKLLQMGEAASSKFWGGGPLRRLADGQTKDVGSRVDSIVDNLSQGADVSPTEAGTAINTGVTAAKQSMRTAEKAAYANVDALVPPQSPIDVSGTLGQLKTLVTPTPGAARSTAALVPAKIQELHDNLAADIAANGGNPQLPYEAASALKTAVGNSIDWGFAPSNPVQNGGLKQVYGALKGDIDTGAAAISPAAAKAVGDAKGLYAANQARRDALNPIIDRAGGPEAVYQAATNGTKNGATKIGQVMGALAPDQQNIVRATVLDRLGNAIPSQQTAGGNAFSVNTFLTNWNKFDPTAKDALFGQSGSPATLRSSLDSLANTTSTIRSSTLLKNPSGTGEAVAHGAGLFAILEGLGATAMGHPGNLAAVGAGFAANNVLARALTNPRTAQWLARSTKAPIGILPNAINQLSQMGQKTQDPDATDLANLLANATTAAPTPTARATGGRVDHESLTARLFTRWKQAQKDADATTEPLLKFPDEAITKALKIAQSHPIT